jgi:predicted CXXCH cytochrome family protein
LGITLAVAVAAATPAEGPPAAKKPAAKSMAKAVPKAPNECLTCHGDSGLWEGERLKYYVTEKNLAGDIHWQQGLVCTDCHGGDATTSESIAAAHSKGFRSIQPGDIPAFCGTCHANIDYIKRFRPGLRTDQLAEYWTSGHGQHLKQGDTSVANCVSCHSHHGIRAVDDLQSPVYHANVAKTCAKCHSDEKLMAGRQYHGRPLGHDQYDLWRQSVHGHAVMDKGDMSAATCNNCHGNHGAVPPQVDSVANACGTCHGKIASLFVDTRMKHKFEQVGLPGCATCHSNHLIRPPSDAMLGMEAGAVCLRCHEKGKFGAPLAGAEVARELRTELESFKEQIAEAKQKVDQAARLGMEVSGPSFDLRKAVNALTNTRVLIHTFAAAPVKASLAEGMKVTAEVHAAAEKALADYTARRIWLGTSLVPIFVVIGMLLLYIRKNPPPGDT